MNNFLKNHAAVFSNRNQRGPPKVHGYNANKVTFLLNVTNIHDILLQ